MNTVSVNSAAGVINAALTQNRTATGIALALDSAQMLLTPEKVAELKKLQDRVAELEKQLAALTAQGQVLRGRPLLDKLTVERAEATHWRRLGVEDPHDSPLYHDYRVSRDLPGAAGA